MQNFSTSLNFPKGHSRKYLNCHVDQDMKLMLDHKLIATKAEPISVIWRDYLKNTQFSKSGFNTHSRELQICKALWERL